MGITITREPVSMRRRKILVQQEVRKALKDLAERAVKRLEDDIKDWKEKPRFITHVAVDDKHWTISIKYDRRERIAKIYGWVDEGTAERGDKGPVYKIKPRRKNVKYLGFFVPHVAKSKSFVPVGGNATNGTQIYVRVKEVTHPGIYPRRFTESMKWWMRSKEPGAFRSTVEAAVKRAFRRLQ
jgi:hypothetical protein